METNKETDENGNLKPKPVVFKYKEDKKESTGSKPFASKRTVDSSNLINDDRFIKHKLNHGVTIILAPDNEENYSKLSTLEDVILLDKRKPSNVAGFHPPLFTEFINKSTNSIKTHVKVNDIVKVKRLYMDKKEDLPREVVSMYLKALNNMTVIIATLNDGDYHLSNRLEVCK